jgi:WXG100 family type VII secretion target
MSASLIQCQYNQLAALAQRFQRQAQAYEVLIRRVVQCQQALRQGGWEGQAALAFHQEMDAEVLPALRRLTEAFQEACRTTHEIAQVMREAEEAAAKPFQQSYVSLEVEDFRLLWARMGGASNAISTPLPKEATFNQTGVASFMVDDVSVRVLPDASSTQPIYNAQGQLRDAVTRSHLHWETPGATVKTKAGKIVSFAPGSPPALTLQTTYGPGAGPEIRSGYGRGTAPEDIKAGKMSLGFHEGSHGASAIEYLKDNSLPRFKGTVGMTKEAFQQARTEYHKQMTWYGQNMQIVSEVEVDCVGIKEPSCEAS